MKSIGTHYIVRLPNILEVINQMRESDKLIKKIYTEGSCYHFYLILKSIFPDAEPYVQLCDGFEEMRVVDHVVTKYKDKFYDITGEIDPKGLVKMLSSEEEFMSHWTFSKREDYKKAVDAGKALAPIPRDYPMNWKDENND